MEGIASYTGTPQEVMTYLAGRDYVQAVQAWAEQANKVMDGLAEPYQEDL